MQLQFGPLLLLGFLAGATILLGLPVGRLKSFSSAWRGSLSMLAAGILAFLLVEIMGQATGQTALALRRGPGIPLDGLLLALLLAFGFWCGFVGLVGVERRLIRGAKKLQPMQLAFMIAIGIGLHNLSEGLAIGQAYLQGMSGLTVSLLIGFALHNATEGFGIVGPVVQRGETISWRTLFTLALIGGGPTFVGTLLGSLWTSPYLSVAVLAMAGGALLYVLKELFAAVRSEATQIVIMTAVVAGFVIGWGTELVADMGLAAAAPNHPAGTMVEADGDVIAIPADGLGPHLSSDELARQNAASNDILHEKGLEPEVLPDGTHRYTLTASVFPWQIFPGVTVQAWGYNQQVPGPLLHFHVGDKVEIDVKNELPQPTTVHWHGLAVPNDMDGVPGVTQHPIAPGGSFSYRFTVTPQMVGTHHYHSHVNDDFQIDQGLDGPLIVDAEAAPANEIDALYVIGSYKVGGSEQENAFVLNGKAYPDAPVLTVPQGAKVRIRMINASAEEAHVMHLHGYTFQVASLDGNPVASPIDANTLNLGASQTGDVVFVANNPGEWMFHCHIMDHVINPGPNGDGSATQMADMGGLMTFINVVPAGGDAAKDYVAAGSVMMMHH